MKCSPVAGLLSEGPRWHEEAGELLWVDILGAGFHRGSIAADGTLDLVASVEFDRHVGAVAPVVGGGYVLAAGTGFLFVDATGRVSELAQPEAGRTDVRMNDGACDPQGRFWAGTMAYDESPGAGALYRLDLDGTWATVLTGLTISNGIGWSPDNRVMYHCDSRPGYVYAYDYDIDSGTPTNRRIHLDLTSAGYHPDGCTVDAEGFLWLAEVGSSNVGRYAPDGRRVGGITLPTPRVTSVMFGGPSLDLLFITTMRYNLSPEESARQPLAGRLFVCEPGVRGMPEPSFAG